jgi:fructose-1,6-bisphosphatase/inositol monophosphatase family enzyme
VTLAQLPVSATGTSAVDIARRAAAAASDISNRRFQELVHGDPVERQVKGRGNFLTETDLACEEAIMNEILAAYPGARILSEETSSTVSDWDSGWVWIVDPIDGTSNFSRGIPTFVINIALCLDGEPVLGLTRQPVTGDEFLAVQGEGLSVNGTPAAVSPAGHLSDALTGMGLGYEYGRAKLMLSLLSDLWPGIQMVQNIGSAALGLAYAASGRFDLYVHSYLFPWDMAAGIIQVREAGGVALARDGTPATIYSEGIIAGAEGPAREFLDATRERPWR